MRVDVLFGHSENEPGRFGARRRRVVDGAKVAGAKFVSSDGRAGDQRESCRAHLLHLQTKITLNVVGVFFGVNPMRGERIDGNHLDIHPVSDSGRENHAGLDRIFFPGLCLKVDVELLAHRIKVHKVNVRSAGGRDETLFRRFRFVLSVADCAQNGNDDERLSGHDSRSLTLPGQKCNPMVRDAEAIFGSRI